MKTKLAFNIIAAAGLAFASIAYAGGVVDGTKNPNHVPGESLDSGLGELASNYDAREYDVTRVAGEKLDSGLGQLASDYDGREYDSTRVAGEKLDSGLGELASSYDGREYDATLVAVKYARGQ